VAHSPTMEKIMFQTVLPPDWHDGCAVLFSLQRRRGWPPTEQQQIYDPEADKTLTDFIATRIYLDAEETSRPERRRS